MAKNADAVQKNSMWFSGVDRRVSKVILGRFVWIVDKVIGSVSSPPVFGCLFFKFSPRLDSRSNLHGRETGRNWASVLLYEKHIISMDVL